MITFPRLFIASVTLRVSAIWALRESRSDLMLENMALRHQLAIFQRVRSRPEFDDVDRGFRVALREVWPGWADGLLIVGPDTLVRWHRERCPKYWKHLPHKNRPPGRPRIEPELGRLIRKMALDNLWGAPRVMASS
jgi:hypothetical protein